MERNNSFPNTSFGAIVSCHDSCTCVQLSTDMVIILQLQNRFNHILDLDHVQYEKFSTQPIWLVLWFLRSSPRPLICLLNVGTKQRDGPLAAGTSMNVLVRLSTDQYLPASMAHANKSNGPLLVRCGSHIASTAYFLKLHRKMFRIITHFKVPDLCAVYPECLTKLPVLMSLG